MYFPVHLLELIRNINNFVKKISAYTDGSCLGNPGPGGWAFVLVEGESAASKKIFFKHSGSVSDTTNNRMEMTAFLEALKYLREKFSSQHVQIFSDSNLLVQTINQGWKRKANLDIWQEIAENSVDVDFNLQWVKAHHVDQFNNECDRLAQLAAQKALKNNSKNSLKKNAENISEKKTQTQKKPAGSASKQASLF